MKWIECVADVSARFGVSFPRATEIQFAGRKGLEEDADFFLHVHNFSWKWNGQGESRKETGPTERGVEERIACDFG